MALKIKHWFLLSRVPFLSVGIMPFIAGTALAAGLGYSVSLSVFLWALCAVVLILLSTHLNGEVHDTLEDSIGAAFGKNIFAGGSGVIPEGKEPAGLVAKVSWSFFWAALVIGCILQFGYKTGPMTLFLGATGLAAGFFYSKPPFRWVKRGFGELFIGYSYGWLPIAAGFYLQTGRLVPIINMLCLPVAFSIFNVIFINEFLDYEADKKAGKRNLLVRVGRDKGPTIYVAASLAASFFALLAFRSGIPTRGLAVALIAVAVSCTASFLVMLGAHRNRQRLQTVCGLTIAANLLFSLSYIITFLH